MIRKFLPKGEFSLNVVTLMTGTIISQAIPVAISPVLTRLYSPEEFGIFALYFSITMVLSVVVTGKYEMAIMLPEKQEDAVNLLSLSIFISFAVSIVLLLTVLFFRCEIAALFNNPEIEPYLFLVPVTTFVIGIYQSLNYWCNRNSRYKRLATNRVARSANSGIWSVFFGLLNAKSGGLIFGDTLGQAAASGLLFRRVWQDDKHFVKEISSERMNNMAKRYLHFPKYSIPSGVLQSAASYIPVMLLTTFFGSVVTGLFSLSQRVISAPGSIVARAFGDVFRQRATEDYINNGNCKSLFLKMFRTLFLLGIAPFALLFIFAPELFSFVFGSEWEIAGQYCQVMTLMFFLQFVVSPLSNMFLVAEKQKYDLYLQVFLFVAVSVSFIAGYKMYNEPLIAIGFFSAAYSVKYLLELFMSYQYSKGKRITHS